MLLLGAAGPATAQELTDPPRSTSPKPAFEAPAPADSLAPIEVGRGTDAPPTMAAATPGEVADRRGDAEGAGEAGSDEAAQGVRLHPVPALDLAAYEPTVARQLAEVQATLQAILARAQGEGETPATPQEIAASFGDLGRHYHAYGLTEAAAAAYRNAALLAPRDVRWPHLLGRALQDAGRLAEAAEAYEAALELAADDVPAILYLAEVRQLQGRTEESQNLYRRALALDPGASAALAGLGHAALEAGQPARAAELLEAALAANPAADRLHHPLGLAYRALGDMERARQHLEAAGTVGLKPTDPLVAGLDALKSGERAHLLRGHVAFRAGHYAEAANAYHRATAAAPESVPARVDLATALSRLGYLEGAEDQLREALALEPGNATTHYNLGVLMISMGEAAGALLHLRQAVRLDPDDGAAQIALGQVLAGQGEEAAAFEHYLRALELGVRDDRAALGAADLLARNGQYRESLEVLEQGFERDPSSTPLLAALARTRAASPDPAVRDAATALDLAGRAWAAESSFSNARTMILALAEAGRCSEAAQWQQRMMEVLRQQGVDPDADPSLATDLQRYQAGPPCRPPLEAPLVDDGGSGSGPGAE